MLETLDMLEMLDKKFSSKFYISRGREGGEEAGGYIKFVDKSLKIGNWVNYSFYSVSFHSLA